MKTVLTVGVFDLLHIGHIKLFQNAHSLGDKLIVAVQNAEYVTKFKPGTQLVYDTDSRRYMVESIRYVDETTVYDVVDEDIKDIDFDILAVGPDQNHSHFQKAFKWCEENGKSVVVIPRTEGISTTLLKN